LRLIFLIVTRAVSLLGLSRRESWWKDAEILMLRHQLAAAEREHPRAHSRLTWPDRAWLALLAGTLPIGRLAAMHPYLNAGVCQAAHHRIARSWDFRSLCAACGRRQSMPALIVADAQFAAADPRDL
jgi:putative transposase